MNVQLLRLLGTYILHVVEYRVSSNQNIKLSNILYHWQLSMASFRFCKTCLLHIKPFVVNKSAIFPFLGWTHHSSLHQKNSQCVCLVYAGRKTEFSPVKSLRFSHRLERTVFEKLWTCSEQVFEEMVVNRFWTVTWMPKPRRAAGGLCRRRCVFFEGRYKVVSRRRASSRDFSAFFTYPVHSTLRGKDCERSEQLLKKPRSKQNLFPPTYGFS